MGLLDYFFENDMPDGFVGIPTDEFKRSVQTDDWSCGPRSVHMILKHYGVKSSYHKILKKLKSSSDHGTTVKDMIRVLRRNKLRVRYQPKMNIDVLRTALSRGAVALVHLDGDHLGVVHALDNTHAYLADPSIVRMSGRKMSRRRFLRRWSCWGLLVAPTT